jgi:uncharacterized protein YecT (DUF1311 family)
MGIFRWVLLPTVAAFLLLNTAVSNAQPACPLKGDEGECDVWHEDQRLAAELAAALARADKLSPQMRDRARENLQTGHRLWLQSRAADCKAEAAFKVGRPSARGYEGYTNWCITNATDRRVKALKEAFH